MESHRDTTLVIGARPQFSVSIIGSSYQLFITAPLSEGTFHFDGLDQQIEYQLQASMIAPFKGLA